MAAGEMVDGMADRTAQPRTVAPIFQSMTHTALLNKPQRNHFAVLLAMMEDSLAEMERLAASDSEPTRELTRWADDLPAGMLGPLRARLAVVREKDFYRYLEVRGRLVDVVPDPEGEFYVRLGRRYGDAEVQPPADRADRVILVMSEEHAVTN